MNDIDHPPCRERGWCYHSAGGKALTHEQHVAAGKIGGKAVTHEQHVAAGKAVTHEQHVAAGKAAAKRAEENPEAAHERAVAGGKARVEWDKKHPKEAHAQHVAAGKARAEKGGIEALIKWAKDNPEARGKALALRPSCPEALTLALLRENGYGALEPEHQIAGPSPTDIALWLSDGRRLAIELDGRAHYLAPRKAKMGLEAVLVFDAAKDAAVRAEGWITVRVSVLDGCPENEDKAAFLATRARDEDEAAILAKRALAAIQRIGPP